MKGQLGQRFTDEEAQSLIEKQMSLKKKQAKLESEKSAKGKKAHSAHRTASAKLLDIDNNQFKRTPKAARISKVNRKPPLRRLPQNTTNQHDDRPWTRAAASLTQNKSTRASKSSRRWQKQNS